MDLKPPSKLAIDPDSAPLKPRDFVRLAQVEGILSRGIALERWWRHTTGDFVDPLDTTALERILESRIHPKCFRLTRPSELWPDTLGYGFLDDAVIHGQRVPVLGRVQQALFDRPLFTRPQDVVAPFDPGAPPHSDPRWEQLLERWSDRVQAFVRHQLLRSSGFESPIAPYVDPSCRSLDAFLEPLSWFPSEPAVHESMRGASNVQLYYKRRATGHLGKFRWTDREGLSLQTIEPGGEFSWVVFSTALHGLTYRFRLPGSYPTSYLTIPLEESRLGILHPAFLNPFEFSDAMTPGQGRSPGGKLRRAINLGFATTEDPATDRPLRAGFATVQFLILEDGKTLIRMIYLRTRAPNPIDYLPNPLTWGAETADYLVSRISGTRSHPFKGLIRSFDPLEAFISLAELSTQGLAAKHLGISKQNLEKRLLIDGALGFLVLVDSLLHAWRAAPDGARLEPPQPASDAGR